MKTGPVTLADVKHWAMDRGIGHIVMSQKDGFASTACNQWGNFHPVVRKRPKRICRRCRAALPNLVRSEANVP